jgi:hypothetical protein
MVKVEEKTCITMDRKFQKELVKLLKLRLYFLINFKNKSKTFTLKMQQSNEEQQ